MEQILLIALMVVSVLIIIAVIMQPTKGNAASMLSGSDDGQVKTKARGFEAFLIKWTSILCTLFFAIALALAFLSGK